MKTILLRSFLGLAAVLGLAATSYAGHPRVIVAGYGPPAVYVPAPAPVTTYYSPSPGVAYNPPVTTYYAPPVTTFYAPSAPVVTTFAPIVPAAPAVVYRPNPILFPRRTVVVAPYGAPYYVPTVTGRVIIP